jgi:two-component system KDP operon response regulator KdpE
MPWAWSLYQGPDGISQSGEQLQVSGETSRQVQVLLVEDDPNVRRMLRFSLLAAGFSLSEATTGGEALDIIANQKPDAVILDLGLPDGRGGSVLQWLRESDARIESGPVWVVITAMDRGEVVKKYGPLGRHFVPKPFNPWMLVDTLSQSLNRESD